METKSEIDQAEYDRVLKDIDNIFPELKQCVDLTEKVEHKTIIRYLDEIHDAIYTAKKEMIRLHELIEGFRNKEIEYKNLIKLMGW